MAVVIRMKKMGRAHRHFFRICATDKRAPRDGKVLEELGTYDPMIAETDARARLNNERVDYWLSVGAQPSEKCAVLIKKYGTDGTHVDAQKAALERMAMPMELPDPGEPASLPKTEENEEAKTEEAPAAEATDEAKPEEATNEQEKADAATEEAKTEEAPAEGEAKAEEEKSE